MASRFDAIILGAGAAGLMCALTAGGRGKRVVVLDHAPEAGRKVLISGGGRGNFTNTETVAERFISVNPHFCKSALASFTPPDFIAMVERHRIAWHEKKLGQLFCDGSARQIVAMLLAECAASGVEIRLGQRVTDVAHNDGFSVATDQGALTAPCLVLATGGLSIPKLGATGLAYDLARRFGLTVVAPEPGLVPLVMADAETDWFRALAGVSAEVVAKHRGKSFRENLLFTHRGLSGPAILQISSYWRAGDISIDLAPGVDTSRFLLDRKRERPKAAVRSALGEILPARLAQALAPEDGAIANLTDAALARLATRLKAWTVTPAATEGYAKAEVTTGGIATAGLSQATMAARDIPGLFAIGEAVDVTGWLGGYNFQWAWASGAAAGRAIL